MLLAAPAQAAPLITFTSFWQTGVRVLLVSRWAFRISTLAVSFTPPFSSLMLLGFRESIRPAGNAKLIALSPGVREGNGEEINNSLRVESEDNDSCAPGWTKARCFPASSAFGTPSPIISDFNSPRRQKSASEAVRQCRLGDGGVEHFWSLLWWTSMRPEAWWALRFFPPSTANTRRSATPYSLGL